MEDTTEPAAEAWVEVYLANGDDGSLVFQVSDSGTGVADTDRDRIFEHGWSTKDATAGGRGYGLALVRQVVESLGGDVEVSHGAGAGAGSGTGTSAGAVFTVTLPRPAAVAPRVRAIDASGARAADAAGAQVGRP